MTGRTLFVEKAEGCVNVKLCGCFLFSTKQTWHSSRLSHFPYEAQLRHVCEVVTHHAVLCWVCIRVKVPLPGVTWECVFIVRFLPTPLPLQGKLCRLMSTDWIWEHWDNDSVTNFSVTFLLCVSAGDFSRRLTSMWRRAAPPEWWPTRIYQWSPYQVKEASIFSSGCYWCRYFMWKNLVSLLLFLSACKLPPDCLCESTPVSCYQHNRI